MPENPLVSTQWLAAHLSDPDLRIVDIRGHVLPASVPPPHYFNHYDDYLTSHIPGAVFIDWVKEITDPDDPRHARLAKPDRYAAAMSRAGIGPNTHVVAYDDAGGLFASRMWWSLSYYGHTRVSVLDGGWQKWITEGFPVTAEMPHIAPTAFVPNPNPAIFRSSDQVQQAIGTGALILDARSPEEFAGQYARAVRTGHIPGAHNLPRSTLISAEGMLLPPEELRRMFEAAGAQGDGQEVITYCNAGVSASMALLAYRVAGFEGGAVYDGSWKDWGNDPARPIE